MEVNEEVKDIIYGYAKDYCEFTGIDKLPEFEIKVVSNEVGEKTYKILVSTMYIPNQDCHKLFISDDIISDIDSLINYKRNFYHEFTHMIDAERYAKRSNDNYTYLFGYTEYHASQVELMYMVGAENINSKPSFSMDQLVLPQTSCRKFLDDKYSLLIAEMSKDSFFKDIYVIKDMIGLLYNYLGLRSICKMYADYKSCEDYSFMVDIFGQSLWLRIFNDMSGWFDDAKVQYSYISYSNAAYTLNRKYEES